MDLNSKGLVIDSPTIRGRDLEEFSRKFKLLTEAERRQSLEIDSASFGRRNLPLPAGDKLMVSIYPHRFPLYVRPSPSEENDCQQNPHRRSPPLCVCACTWSKNFHNTAVVLCVSGGCRCVGSARCVIVRLLIELEL